MDLVSFIYNIILLILYSCAISSCFYAYLNTQSKVYCHFIELFVFFLFDLSIIYILEFVYDVPLNVHSTAPMSAFPVLRMAVFSIGLLAYIRIFNALTADSWGVLHIVPFVLNLIPIVIVSLGADGKSLLMDWLIYSSRYVAMILMLIYFLQVLRRSGCALNSEEKAHVKKLDYFILASMILALFENTVVLIIWEQYASWLASFAPKLSERIFTEDIYSIILSLGCIYGCHKTVKEKLARSQEAAPSSPVLLPPVDAQESRLEAFCDSLKLTRREREIISLLLQDKSNQEISDELFISLGTAKTHVHNIFQKAGAAKRRQLIERFWEFTSEGKKTIDK